MIQSGLSKIYFLYYNSKFKKILVICESLFIGVSNLLHKKLESYYLVKFGSSCHFQNIFHKTMIFCYFSSSIVLMTRFNRSHTKEALLAHYDDLFTKCWEHVSLRLSIISYILFNPFSVETFQWSIYWNFNNVSANKNR